MSLIRIDDPSVPPASEITPQACYLDRRRLMATGLAASAGLLWPGLAAAAPLSGTPGRYSTSEAKTPLDDITRYNNFYEFGADKGDPARNAGHFKPRPWAVEVGGFVDRPRTFSLDEILKLAPLEERIYRLRCVEGWSMVIPWLGFPLSALLKQVGPQSRGKFVEFVTVSRPAEMPGQRMPLLDWPYREGLRIDEAMHPLAILAVGLYGETLPNQNGAPVRLVVPWKYGFKSIKSIVKINLVERSPQTSWMKSAPDEYGFFSNVNPDVDHPRWSQATERRIGELFKRKTLPFNGYGEQVAGLYRGLDLRKWF